MDRVSLLVFFVNLVTGMNQQPRNWTAKFRDAGRGLRVAVRFEKSYRVHFLMAIAVVIAGFCFQVTKTEWCVLTLSIFAVLAAETFNSSIEYLAKAVTKKQDTNIGYSLDMAAGAVLVISIGAAIIGVMVFVPYAVAMLQTGL